MLVHEFLEQSAEIYPQKTAFVSQGKRYTYLEIENTSNKLSKALMDKGLKKQDRVVVFLDPCFEEVVSIFSTLKADGVFVVLNPQVKAKKAKKILNDCRAKILITDSSRFKSLLSIFPECSSLKTMILTDQKQTKKDTIKNINQEVISFWEVLKDYSAGPPLSKCSEKDLAALIYTSGSTGIPKGAMLTHSNMVFAANAIIEYLENTPDDIILNVLPFSFDYGLYQLLMTFKFGGTLIQEKSFLYPYQYIDLVLKEKVTGLPMVPTIAAILFNLIDLDKYDFSSIRYITTTGQTLPPSYIPRLKKIFPQAKIYSMYGLTECKRVSYLPPDELEKRPTSVGKPMANTQAYIVDEKGKKITKPWKVGELVVKGPHVMKGYWNLPQETEKVLKSGFIPKEKVLYTGDLFKMDEQGFLYFVSRKDDVFKVSGRRVSPKEIEDVIYEIEDVNEAAVLGVDDEITGSAVKAYVTLKNGSKLIEKDIIRYCSKHIENFMVPSFVVIQEELPKSEHGKIIKKDLLHTHEIS